MKINLCKLLIDSQESSSQGDYFPKRKIQHLESPESPVPLDVDELFGASNTITVILWPSAAVKFKSRSTYPEVGVC